MATLAEARLKACRLWPYGASAILSLVPVETTRTQLMAVDGHWRIYVNPPALAKVDVETAARIVLHEVYHLLLNHHERAARLLPEEPSAEELQRWNVAADLAINSRLAAEGLKLPDWTEAPERYDLAPELAAEEYYRLLAPPEQTEQPNTPPGDDGQPRNQPDDSDAGDDQTDDDAPEGQPGEDDQPGDAGDSNQPGDQPGDGATDGTPGDAEGEGQPGDQPGTPGTGNASGDGQPGDPEPWNGTEAPDGGSCADGQPRDYELGDPTDDAPGLQPHEAREVIRDVAAKIEQKSRGTGRGGMGAWANEIINPKLDPRAALLRAVRHACETTTGAGDWSYRRPSRRSSGDIVRPGNVQPVPRITVIVDTSGSMDRGDIGLSLGLVGKVLNGFRLREGIRVICWDSGLQSVGKVFSPGQIQLAGRGGTDIDQAIEHVAREDRPRPQLIVVCTDGFTAWPAQPVPVPVVACLTNDRAADSVPAWIQKISLTP